MKLSFSTLPLTPDRGIHLEAALSQCHSLYGCVAAHSASSDSSFVSKNDCTVTADAADPWSSD
jgi:hypothetical protein